MNRAAPFQKSQQVFDFWRTTTVQEGRFTDWNLMCWLSSTCHFDCHIGQYLHYHLNSFLDPAHLKRLYIRTQEQPRLHSTVYLSSSSRLYVLIFVTRDRHALPAACPVSAYHRLAVNAETVCSLSMKSWNPQTHRKSGPGLHPIARGEMESRPHTNPLLIPSVDPLYSYKAKRTSSQISDAIVAASY
ncbi:unnamed protein product [Albugo candida]|uniref:Uncharacterized protein n=1 Tax=Albugo candida TaxID=65357 RepID=A0A024FVA6_9STRA|nr:unnamed protein product [Albugo candida]|eukprot:CCI11088.1 unnamed protein product [Albugo candida]